MFTSTVILNPTRLQATRLDDGHIMARVSVESHAPSYAYISLSDYRDAEAGRLIEIHEVSEPSLTGYVTVRYSVK